MSLIKGITINSVAALYQAYGSLTPAYTAAENPLHPLTAIVPMAAHHYCVVTPQQEQEAKTLMQRIAGRRKLRISRHDKDDLRQPHFAPTREVILIYA